MKTLCLVGIAFSLSACATNIPNAVNETKSSFDNSIQVLMEPGFIYRTNDTFSGAAFKVGLFWSTTMKEQIFITANVTDIVNIKSEGGLQFNIDGEIVTLDSDELLTKFDSTVAQNIVYSDSLKRFPTNLSFIKKLVSAKKVMARLVTGDGMMEGEFTVDKPSAAVRGFRETLAKIEAIK